MQELSYRSNDSCSGVADAAPGGKLNKTRPSDAVVAGSAPEGLGADGGVIPRSRTNYCEQLCPLDVRCRAIRSSEWRKDVCGCRARGESR